MVYLPADIYYLYGLLIMEFVEHKPGPEQQYYNEGHDAYVAGKARDSNPYKNATQAACWDEGWEVAAQYAEAEKYIE